MCGNVIVFEGTSFSCKRKHGHRGSHTVKYAIGKKAFKVEWTPLPKERALKVPADYQGATIRDVNKVFDSEF